MNRKLMAAGFGAAMLFTSTGAVVFAAPAYAAETPTCVEKQPVGRFAGLAEANVENNCGYDVCVFGNGPDFGTGWLDSDPVWLRGVRITDHYEDGESHYFDRHGPDQIESCGERYDT